MTITRFSPSNTSGGAFGSIHLGNARTALVSYVLAKKAEGEFHVRIEDTDLVRSHKEHTVGILQALDWLGMKSDKEITYQTKIQETGLYAEVAKTLVNKGFAYYCTCSVQTLKEMKANQIATKARQGYIGTCKDLGNTSGVLRLNVKAIAQAFGSERIFIDDIVLGMRHEDYRNLPDPVLLRSDGTVGYLLANTVDDTMAGINLIARGSDLYSQTALQVLLRLAIDGSRVQYAHLPLMYNEAGNKLSKRSADTKGILQYKAEGYLPDAIIQFALSLGNTSIPTDRALSLQEIIESYDITKTNNKATSFVEHKITHLNKLHIRALDNERLSGILLENYGLAVEPQLIALFKMRVSTLNELADDLSFIISALKTHFDSLKKLVADNFSAPSCKSFREATLGGRKTPPLDQLVKLIA